MVGLDPVAREGKRVKRGRLDPDDGGGELIGCHPRADAVEVETVELSRVVAERIVAAEGNVAHDRAHRRRNVGGGLTLGIEKRPKPWHEIGCAGIEADGHDNACWRCGDPSRLRSTGSRFAPDAGIHVFKLKDELKDTVNDECKKPHSVILTYRLWGIITILIFCFLIDKSHAVHQFLGYFALLEGQRQARYRR